MSVDAWKTARKCVLLLISVAPVVATTLVDDSTLNMLTQDGSLTGLLCVGLIVLATQICAPLSATAVIVLSARAYGALPTMLVFYAACMMSAAINFWLSRLFGRALVRRLTSHGALLRVQELLDHHERELLVIARVFGFYFFDLISYAAGLGRLRFWRYYIYTGVLSLLPMSAEYLVLVAFDLSRASGVLGFNLAISAGGALFAWGWIWLKQRSLAGAAPAANAHD